MAAVTITQLSSRIQSELNKPSADITAKIVDSIVTAIRFYEGKRLWFLEKSSTVILLNTTSSIALPTDFKSLILLRLLRNGYYYGPSQGFYVKDILELRDASTNSAATGYPQMAALFAGSIHSDRIADQNYTFAIDYEKGDVTYPATGTDTSVWFDDGVDLIRTKTLAIVYADVLHDEQRASYYEEKASEYLRNLTIRNNIREQSHRLPR